MEPAPNHAFYEPLPAAMPQLSEKPHLGGPSRNQAWNQGPNVCNSTTVLGLRAALHLERIRSRYTGKERDAESGNDYFNARYFGSSMGRFMSPDPLPWISWQDGDKDERARFEGYIANPQNFNLYAYVRNNPLIYTDPTGESIYAVFYTYGNKNINLGGDDDLKSAAETRAKEIESSKGFDPKKDKVLVIGVNSKEDFKNAIGMINGMDKQFGKVAELSVFSHSGQDGPVFPGAASDSRASRQFIATNDGVIDMKQLSALHVNWESNAWAGFFGCHARTFADAFAKTQGVHTFGYRGGVDFYAYPQGRWYQLGEMSAGPVYMRPGIWNNENQQ
jgi:RHS repeat-associated protein